MTYASDFSHNPRSFDAALRYYRREQNTVKKIKLSSENKRSWRANPSKREPHRESEKFTLRAKMKSFSEGLYENLITKIH